jgi:glutathione S-transferase
MSDLYRIFGALGSPYSMKMRAILRYRRLPHVWIAPAIGKPEIAHVRPPVIPVIQFPDGEYHVDSTPMIDALERTHPGARSVVPADPGLAFLAYLLEDFADEWVTKMMFHYRWFRERDQEACSRFLAFDTLGVAAPDAIERAASTFRNRQIGRMPLVGCTAQNQPLIEGTFLEVLDIFESHLRQQRYLFGSRPSRADFAFFGQLSQLAVDPTPAALMQQRAPFTHRWVTQMDDVSGEEGEWMGREAGRSPAVTALLRLTGEVYLPFLVANAAAFDGGAETFSLEVREHRFEQGTFKYQVKCLAELRRHFLTLAAGPRAEIEPVLRDAGCLEVLTGRG